MLLLLLLFTSVEGGRVSKVICEKCVGIYDCEVYARKVMKYIVMVGE